MTHSSAASGSQYVALSGYLGLHTSMLSLLTSALSDLKSNEPSSTVASVGEPRTHRHFRLSDLEVADAGHGKRFACGGCAERIDGAGVLSR